MATTRTSTTGSRAGFTLLELLIALTLGAVLVTSAYQAMGAALAARDRAERAMTPVAQARYVFACLDKDLRRLDPRLTKDDLSCAAGRCRFPVQAEDGSRTVVSYVFRDAELVREERAAQDEVSGLAAGSAFRAAKIAVATATTTVAARGLSSAVFAAGYSGSAGPTGPTGQAGLAGLGANAPFPKLVSLHLSFEDRHGEAGRFNHAVFLEISPDDDQSDAR